jgi:broad specificity phosphatase PhoE
MDPPLHYFGKRQCEYLKQFVHKVDFSVVFISPLLRYWCVSNFFRTVQTAQILFQDHPKKKQIKFILLPIAAEKMSS